VSERDTPLVMLERIGVRSDGNPKDRPASPGAGVRASRLRRPALATALLLSLALGAAQAGDRPVGPILRTAMRVGVRHTPPYYYYQPGTKPTGLGVDVVEQAARRLGVEIRWVEIPVDRPPSEALARGEIDIWPVVAVRPEAQRQIHVTEPYLQSNYFLLVPEESDVQAAEDVRGRTVAFVRSRIETRLSRENLAFAQLEGYMSAEEALQAVCRGRAAAAFLEARGSQALLLKRPQDCEGRPLRFVSVPGASVSMGIGATRAAAAVADALRSEVNRLAEDGTLDGIIARWSFVTTRETQTVYSGLEGRRRVRILGAGLAAMAAALIVSLWQVRRVRAAEHALRQSEERYRSLVENAHDIVYTRDMAGRVTSLNRAGEAILGYAREEAVGRDIDTVLAPESKDAVAETARLDAAGESATPREVTVVAKDGRRVVLEVIARTVYERGRPAAVQGVARDVTDRKQLEEQLRQFQKMEAVGNLAGGVAHDFNNLLTVILGYAQMLHRSLGQSGSQARMAAGIEKAAQQAAALTAQLLAFGRRQRVEPRLLDLNGVVQGAESLLKRLIGEHIELVTDLAPSLDPIRADPSQIQQVVMNLAINARDAMPRGGCLTIRTGPVGAPGDGRTRTPHVALSVEDSGVGMAREVRERAFEPFFTTKEVGKGTGLGLSTVYGIVQQCGGRIEVASELGQGSRFTVILPSADGTAEREDAAVSEKASLPSVTALLVEDEAAVRAIMRIYLEEAGLVVLEAPDGAAALSELEQRDGRIDLLITDVVMPGMSGPTLVERARERCPDLRVLLVSGYSQGEFGHEATTLLANSAFLQKPFAAAELAEKLRGLLGPAVPGSAHPSRGPRSRSD
jgi:PAS domain S-box-containing protein